MTEVLFPRVVDADDTEFDAQREFALWQYNAAEHSLHHDELDFVQTAQILEYLNEAHFVIDSLTKAGVRRGVLTQQLSAA